KVNENNLVSQLPNKFPHLSFHLFGHLLALTHLVSLSMLESHASMLMAKVKQCSYTFFHLSYVCYIEQQRRDFQKFSLSMHAHLAAHHFLHQCGELLPSFLLAYLITVN